MREKLPFPGKKVLIWNTTIFSSFLSRAILLSSSRPLFFFFSSLIFLQPKTAKEGGALKMGFSSFSILTGLLGLREEGKDEAKSRATLLNYHSKDALRRFHMKWIPSNSLTALFESFMFQKKVFTRKLVSVYGFKSFVRYVTLSHLLPAQKGKLLFFEAHYSAVERSEASY